jgi:hypothetical protein
LSVAFFILAFKLPSPSHTKGHHRIVSREKMRWLAVSLLLLAAAGEHGAAADCGAYDAVTDTSFDLSPLTRKYV